MPNPTQTTELDIEHEKILSLALDPIFKVMEVPDANRRNLFDAIKISLKILYMLGVDTEVNKVLDELQADDWKDDNTQLNITRHDYWQSIDAVRQDYPVKEKA